MAQSNPLKSIQKGHKSPKSSRSGGKIKPKTMATGLLVFFAVLLIAVFILPSMTGQSADQMAETEPESAAGSAETFYASSGSEDPSDSMGDRKKNNKIKTQQQNNINPKETTHKSGTKTEISDLWSINYEQQAQPQLTLPVTSQIIRHTAYSTSYNAEYKIPNWTFYELTLTETLGRLPRSDNFQPDPNVSYRESAQLSDYRGSGYDRGHMAPSMDFNWDEAIEDESYYLSNMCPQGHDFNAGIWLDLEHQVRRWAERDSAICVACGPILPRKDKNGKLINPVTGEEYQLKTIGRSKVLVPEHFFKVILSPFGDHPKAIGFVMPNHNVMRRDGRGNAPIRDFAKNIDYVEKVTGIDFFAILPDDIEDKIEAWYENDDWFKKSNNYRK